MSARLLVVEDDPRLRSVLARGLEAEGYVVDSVGDGAGLPPEKWSSLRYGFGHVED